MSQEDVATWLSFAMQQMAAESYLDQLLLGRTIRDILLDGNNDTRIVQPDSGGNLPGKTRFTAFLADQFAQRYQIIDHHANDASGFSATLLLDRESNSYTLSFRSTEPRPAVEGGDVERDGLFASGLTQAADGEIVWHGFAFGQLIAMERYYLELTTTGKLPDGARLNVTGFSLGGHLATVFTELHASEVAHTYVFNAAGRGRIDGFIGLEANTLAAEAGRINDMLLRFMTVLFNPIAGGTRSSDEEMQVFQAALDAHQQNPTWDPFTSGSEENLYVDPRYRWARLVTLDEYRTQGIGSVEIGTSLSGSSVTEGAFSKITQIYGDAAFGDDTLVALSGLSAGPAQSVLIEGQPLLPGTIIPRLSDIGSSHSLTLIVDSLAVQELIHTIDSRYGQASAELLIRAASNNRAIDTATEDRAEGDSLEKLVDAFRMLFLGPALPDPTPLNVDFSVGGFANFTFRNQMYNAMADIRERVEDWQGQGVIFRLEDLTDPAVIGSNGPEGLAYVAQTDTARGLAYRYALKELNPFALWSEEITATDVLYEAHNMVGQLGLFDPTDGSGMLTAQYLADRAQFLLEKVALNMGDRERSSGTIIYRDLTQGYEIGTHSFLATDQRFLFGSDQDDAPLIGESEADHLYGGDGTDVVNGQGGGDYLEGNGGHDWLLGGDGHDVLLGQHGNDLLEGGGDDDRLTGGVGDDQLHGGPGFDVYYLHSGAGQDTILDGDGRGLIQVDQRLLLGGIRKPTDAAHTYTSLDGRFQYVASGTSLLITNQQSPSDVIIVEHYTPGLLGIRLIDLPGVVSQQNGLPTKTNDGFPPGEIDNTSNQLILDGSYNFVIDALAGNDYVVGGGGNDLLSGGAGQDTLFGLHGNDYLYGGADSDTLHGGNDDDWVQGDEDADRLFGGAGGDWLLGGEGEDDLDGGDGNDFLDAEGGTGSQALSGGVGDDVLIGGAGKDSLYGDERDGSRISEGGNDVLYGGSGGDGGVIEFGLQGDAGSDILIGGEEDDKLLGDGFNNPAFSWDPTYDGRDWLDGGSGNDGLVGGGNDDILVGGYGDDLLIGDYSNVFLNLGGNDFLDGGDGADILIGGMRNDTLYGGTGHDVLYGDNESSGDSGSEGGNDFLDGEAGDDRLFGGAGHDVLLGGLGDDVLNGGDEGDFLDGGAGDDSLDGGAGFDSIHGGPGNDRLVAGFRPFATPGFEGSNFGQDSISQDADLLLTGADPGRDELYGDGGNDYLVSAHELWDTDDSLLVGGSGDDTYEVDSIGDMVIEAAHAGVDTVISYVSYTLGDNFENLSLRGLTTVGYGNSLNNVMSGGRWLEGMGGDDTLTGVGHLDGGTGNDSLRGGSAVSYFSQENGTLEYLANSYVFGLGYGQDTILESDAVFNSAYYRNEDSILFSDAIAPSDVSWERVSNDLIISVGEADRITVPSFYDLRFDRGGYLVSGLLPPPQGLLTTTSSGFPTYVAPSRIELVEFADGTIWDAMHFSAPLLGDFRSDTYRFGRGTGDLFIIDFDFTPSNATRELDSVLIGADVVPNDLSLSRIGDDLVLRIDETNDRLTIQAFFQTVTIIPPFSFGGYSVAPYRIEEVIFVDSSVWSVSDLFNRLSTIIGTPGADTISGNQNDNLIQGLSGDDYLSGQGGMDVLAGGRGNDRLFGGDGDDTYVFNLGDGRDIIADTATVAEGNRIEFGVGILGTDLRYTEDQAAHTLTIRVGMTGDEVVLSNFDPLGVNGSVVVERLLFADGSVVDLRDMLNRAPVVAHPLGDVTVSEDAAFIFFVPADTFSDEDPGDVLTLSASLGDGSPLPTWLHFDAETSAFTGMPGDAQVGSLEIQVTASDRGTLSVADIFILTVTNVNEAPTVAISPTDLLATEDAPFRWVVPAGTFADVDPGDTLTYGATLTEDAPLPTWLMFDAATRTFSGTPLNGDVGRLAVQITATDQGGLSASAALTVVIQNVNDAPIVAGALADQIIHEDVPFAMTVPADAFDDEDVIHGDLLIYHAALADGSPLPIWLSFDATERAFTGTPGPGDAASFEIAITATDREAISATDLFTLTVLGPLPQTLIGTAGHDVLTGGRGDDTLIGYSGNDVLDGGSGVDMLVGGAGNDVYLVGEAGDAVVELPNEGFDTVISEITAMLQPNVEALVLTGMSAINGSGNSLMNSLTGNGADNVLDGGAGADVMLGLDGHDAYIVDHIGDIVVEFAGQGNDTVMSSVTYTLGTSLEYLTLTGNAAINGTGNALDNWLVGNGAANTLVGGAGNDTYVVGNGDTVSEKANEGIDTVYSSVSWTLGAHAEHLTLIGSSAINGTGNGLANTLIGNSADNVLSAGGGHDILRGGVGHDTIYGGNGNDTYLFGRGDGQDVVQDSAGPADKILYEAGINPLDLVISRQVNDLRLSIYGAMDSVTIQNWYAGSSNQTESIQAGNGEILLGSQVDQLIQSMAGFTQHTGLTWEQAIEQRPQEVQAVLAASWH